MKKLLTLILVLGLIAGALSSPAVAGKKKKKKSKKIERVVEFDYMCPCGVKVLGNGPAWQLGSATEGEYNIGGGAVTFNPMTEKFLKIESEDDAGMPVAIRIAMDTDPDDTSVNNTVADVCGKTEEPIKMPDVEAEFRVFVTSGTCADGTPTMATQGMITFTLSNLP